jgi:hypothetical protein
MASHRLSAITYFYRVKNKAHIWLTMNSAIWSILRPERTFLQSCTDQRKSVTFRPFPESCQNTTRPHIVQNRTQKR